MFKLTGISAVTANMNKEVAKLRLRSVQGLILSSIIIRRSMAKSPPLVPVDVRNLEASWFTVTAMQTPAGKSTKFKGDDAGVLSAGHMSAKSKAKGMAKSEPKPLLVMGFSAYYAPYVHENMEAKFQRPGAGPKFLEAALKNNKDIILKTIKESARIR